MEGVKGKFITLTGMLMSNKPEFLNKANDYLSGKVGLTHLELDPEDFYDTKVWDEFIRTYCEASGLGEEGYIVLGKRVYPTIKRTSGLPEHLNTPLDFIKFEAEGFLQNHSGNITPRKFLKTEVGEVIVYAPAPGYNSKLYIGVFQGILEICGINNGHVEEIEKDTFKITW